MLNIIFIMSSLVKLAIKSSVQAWAAIINGAIAKKMLNFS